MATPSKLRMAMFKSNITVAELARRIGTTKQYLSVVFKTEDFTEEMKDRISQAMRIEKEKLFK